MEEQLIGYTLAQHRRIERALLASELQVGEPIGVPQKRREPAQSARVISLEARSYDSRLATALPVFNYFRPGTARIISVEMHGSALSGYVVLTIGDQSFTIECRRPELSYVVASVQIVERIEVFPGLWEIHLDPESTEDVTCRRITIDEDATLCELFDDEESVMFTGSLVVRPEAWGSMRRAGELVTATIVDAIPYLTGQVPAGSVGLATWRWDCGYVVTGWQCRTFAFAVGYDVTEDPVPQDEHDPGSGGDGGGGGDGPGDPDPEEPPPDAGEADWEWDGDFWVLTANRCGSGYSPFAPVLPGFFVGQTGSAPCQL